MSHLALYRQFRPKTFDEVIAQNDIKQPQAVLEIAILELSAHGNRTVDPQWTIAAGSFQLGYSGTTVSLDFNSNMSNPFKKDSNTSSSSSSFSRSWLP